MDTGTARKWNPEPRRGPGRRYADGREDPAVRGLLHDLGHEATTLAYLVDAVRGEPGFPSAARVRLELVSLEVSRLLDIIFHGVPDDHGYDETDIVDVRALAGQVAVLASARHRTSVVLRPGPAMSIQVNSVLLWRVLSNVIGNAARAASAPPTAAARLTTAAPPIAAAPPTTAVPATADTPLTPGARLTADTPLTAGAPPTAGTASAASARGRVEVAISRAEKPSGAPDIVIHVIDDGPGFRKGPPGRASLGLAVTTSLLRSFGGRLEVFSLAAGGTRVRITLPARFAANAPPASAKVSAP